MLFDAYGVVVNFVMVLLLLFGLLFYFIYNQRLFKFFFYR